MDENARMKILEMIEAGTVSAEEGLQLLQALSESAQSEQAAPGKEPASTSKDKPFFVIETGSKKAAGAETDQVDQFEAQSFGEDAGEGIVDEAAAEILDDAVIEDDSTYEYAASTGKTAPAGNTSHDARDEGFTAASDRTGERGTYSRTATPPFPADVEKCRRWWMIPLWVGVGATILAGLWMYNAFVASGFGFWFLCAWIPLLLGVGLMALSYSSRSSRWLHLRVDQKPGERPQHIAISMPLPLGLVSWFFKYFGHFIPNIPEGIQVEEILQAVSENTSQETPFYVEVDEGENGEKVKVYIG